MFILCFSWECKTDFLKMIKTKTKNDLVSFSEVSTKTSRHKQQTAFMVRSC